MSSQPASTKHDLPPEQAAIQAKCVHANGTFVEFSVDETDQSITSRFEKQVSLCPSRLAVKTPTHRLTYKELNKASNRLAHVILREPRRIGPNIALLLGHDAMVVTAMLGVLKAGKSFVALDISESRERLAEKIQDSEAGLIIADEPTFFAAAELAEKGVGIVRLDALGAEFNSDNPRLVTSPDELCCVIYTSGSTGRPKGVVHSHRTILHSVMNCTNAYHICPEDRLVGLSRASTIAGTWDIFSAILNGASLHPFDVQRDSAAPLARYLIDERITVWNSAATLFRHFVGMLNHRHDRFPELRIIRIGGEAVYRSDVELFNRAFSRGCILITRLGGTEIGISTQYFVDQETSITGPTVPVGHPSPGYEFVLINDAGDGVDFGEIGEITVKSRYVALGYWQSPELTRKSFVTDTEESDHRTFLTGDLALRQPDGCLIHMGRKDFRVKVRGYRVEIPQVEQALLGHPHVKEAAVEPYSDSAGQQRLVAYIVPERGDFTVSGVRRYLSSLLPDYMVPPVFVTMESLPLSTSGKVDRKALPPLTGMRPELADAYVPPRTPVEAVMADIWADVLEIDQVGVHDDFLDLGGDSLRAGQVVSRVISAFGVESSIQALMQSPTVTDVSLIITQRRAEEADEAGVSRLLSEVEALPDLPVPRS